MDNVGQNTFTMNGRILSDRGSNKMYSKVYSDYHKYKKIHSSDLGTVRSKGNRVNLELNLSGKDVIGRIAPVRVAFSIKDTDLKDPTKLKTRLHAELQNHLSSANKIPHSAPHVMDTSKVDGLIDRAIHARKQTIFKNRLYIGAGLAGVTGLGLYSYLHHKERKPHD